MGLFSKSEVVILKESSDAKQYLDKLEALLPDAQGTVKEQIKKEIAITKAGIVGEESVLFELQHSNMDMVVLHDIYLETEDGLGAQIDFIVITPKITFIIECKNLFGNIEIDSTGNFIRTMEFGERKVKEGIYSPITQNERHMNVLKECNAESKGFIMSAASKRFFKAFYKSLVVLANPKTIVNDRYAKKEIKNQVIRADQLITVMKKMISESKESSLSKNDMIQKGKRFQGKNLEDRKEYIKRFEDLVAETKNTTASEKPVLIDEEQLCPRCGKKLVLRTASRGENKGNQFYGCSGYPSCRYIKNIT